MKTEPRRVSGPAAFPLSLTDLTLTDLERRALTLVAEGKRNADISRLLELSMGEIQSVLDGCRQRLGAHNLMHAVSLALLLGHIDHVEAPHG